LQRLLRSALEHCPWHAQRLRSCGLADVLQKDPLSWADFRRLPTMSKRDARENGEAMRWSAVPGGAFPTAPAAPAASR
jgi:phenylacetate-CoA ligase